MRIRSVFFVHFLGLVFIFGLSAGTARADESDLVWSTFLGGSSDELGYDIVADETGYAFVIGNTGSSDFPTIFGSYDSTYNGGFTDVFVTKFNTSGSGLVFSTFLGGSGDDNGLGIALDNTGNVYLTGWTDSDDFPVTTAAHDTVWDGRDAFAAKLNAFGGGHLLYSTYIGGSYQEFGEDIAVHSSSAYVVGSTGSDDFPCTPGAFDTVNAYAVFDAFVVKINADGSDLDYATYLGGTETEYGYDIAVDDSGKAYATGVTYSSDFQTTAGAFQTTYGDYGDVFVTKLNAGGTDLDYSTYLGGEDEDIGWGIVLDDAGNAYVTGSANSSDFPTTPGAYDTSFNEGYFDIFAARLNADGSGLDYSTYIGGWDEDQGRDIDLDDAGYAYVTGWTFSSNFPATPDAYDTTYGAESKPFFFADVIVAKLNPPGSSLEYATFLGHDDSEYGYGLSLDGSAGVYLTGQVYSPNFPTTPGAYNETINGDWTSDVFVSKMDLAPVTAWGAIGGTVSEAKGPIAGVVITAGSGRDTTSAAGAYLIENLPVGSYTVQAVALGYQIGTQTGIDVLEDDTTTVNFSLEPWDSELEWSTYLGGSSGDQGRDVALDDEGNVYITGQTFSDDFPVTAGTYDSTHNGYDDVIVAKFNPSGNVLIFAALFGGAEYDNGHGIAVDGDGNSYVTGFTWGEGFPTTPGAFDSTFDGIWDVFVTKLNADGSDLLYSTYLTGNERDSGEDIAIDEAGYAYVTGWTRSSNFSVTGGALQTTYGGSTDGFVTKVNADGTGLVYSTFLGGSSADEGHGIFVDETGAATVGGFSYDGFPVTTGAYDTTHNGEKDVFLARLNAAGNGLVFATYAGGSGEDGAEAVDLDDSGNVYATGWTLSADFPTTPGAHDSTLSSSDGFALKLTADGSGLTYSTFLGGSSGDYGEDIAVDGSGTVCITGQTISSDFPITSGAWDSTYNGSEDAFVVQLSSSGGTVTYGTYLGTDDFDTGYGIAVDDAGHAYVAGETHGSDFPTTPGTYDNTHNGQGDVFVCKLAVGSGLPPAPPMVPENLTITLAGEDLFLEWDPVITDINGSPIVIDSYYVYRKLPPDFFGPGSDPFDGVPIPPFKDTTNAAGDTLNNYHYAVKAVAGGMKSEFSAVVGEFDGKLANGTK